MPRKKKIEAPAATVEEAFEGLINDEQPGEKEPPFAPGAQKRVRPTTISFTDYELIHLRDLFAVLLPPVGEKTVSQALATIEDRVLVEQRLWAKFKAACDAANIATENEAPDFVIAPTGVPPMNVFQLADTPGDPTVEKEEGDEGDEEKSSDEERDSLFRTGEKS